ncbi:c-type cytochrome [Roseomonas harenae]|jgi:cytochrome c|uniref:c-type cytochrome n=1 Tax=Muricoccus harenae TaxID=2692566 RepID=UPI002E2B4A55|nr:cytochrome c family protein [Roseomonas harenae]
MQQAGAWHMLKFVSASAILLALGTMASAQQAGGDVSAGQRVFGQCRACHALDRNLVGPHLRGVVGRPAGSLDGFRYSTSMRQKAEGGLVWSEDTLRAYIRNPKEVVPGGSMAFAGLRNEQQLNDLLAYLREQK